MSGWSKVARTFAATKGLDPDVEWLLDAGAAQNLFLRTSLGTQKSPEPPFAFLLSPLGDERKGRDLLDALDTVLHSDSSGKYRFNMPQTDRSKLENGEDAFALCNAEYVRALNNSTFAGLDKSMKLSSAMPSVGAPAAQSPPFAVPDGLADALANTFPGDKVVVGVIDDGFAIAHPRLRLAKDKTRIASYWDQEAEFAGNESTVPFGRELLKVNFNSVKGLDDILGGYTGPIPEIYGDQSLAKFYPKKRSLMPRNASHGTGVLDLAAGAEMGTGADRPVVAVKLPRESVRDTSGAHLEGFLLEGVRHILSRAAMIFGNAQPKVVIVASYGFFGGPLDGSSKFARSLDQIIATHLGRVQIILPSGNGRMDRAHAVRETNGVEGQRRTVDWRVPADDRTASVMEIWSEPIDGGMPAETLNLTVVSPDGQSSAALQFSDVEVGQKLVLKGKLGTDLAQAVCDHPNLHPGRRRFMIWLAPNAFPPPDVAQPDELSPAGVWKVQLTNVAQTATNLSFWIRRDDSLPDFPVLGRQSSVERDPPQEGPIPLNQRQWDQWDDYGTASVKGSISTIATGQLTVVTCGFGAGDDRPARSAAGGPVAPVATGAPNPPPDPPGRRHGPDCLAPSRVTALRGIKAANFFGGSKVSFTGTSFSSPLVGHWLATAYLSGMATMDGRLKTKLAAEASDIHMLQAWKPALPRGDFRFINEAMKKRTFQYDNIP